VTAVQIALLNRFYNRWQADPYSSAERSVIYSQNSGLGRWRRWW